MLIYIFFFCFSLFSPSGRLELAMDFISQEEEVGAVETDLWVFLAFLGQLGRSGAGSQSSAELWERKPLAPLHLRTETPTC